MYVPVSKHTVVGIEPGELQHLDLQSGISELHQVSMIGSIHIFVAKFENTTQCSKADVSHFYGAYVDEEHIIKNGEDNITSFYDNLDKRGLGWHFFSLGDDSIRAASTASTLTPLKSDVPESDRIIILKVAMTKIFMSVAIFCNDEDRQK